MEEELPQKLFYTIAEVSKVTGIKPYILRYWESEFTQLKPEREKGRRRYRNEDIQTVMCIKKLLYKEGYTISGARSKLREERKSGDKQEITKLKKQLQDLLKMIKKD
jgi:DNA-binding transcriptional MerR regulator